MKTRIALGKERQMAQAHDYEGWRTHALDLDTMNGMDVWKADPNSPHYQYNLIQQRLINLRNWRKNGDWAQVVFALREGLQRNLGNMTNPELYKHTHVGTKYLIDEYLGEVVSTLNYLCDHDIPDFPSAEKLLFFRHTGQSFGRSSLMLSGGANMGMFHVGVIKALFEQNLLPRVVSGSSAGSVVAAFIGTRKDNEFEGLFTGEAMDLKLWRRLGSARSGAPEIAHGRERNRAIPAQAYWRAYFRGSIQAHRSHHQHHRVPRGQAPKAAPVELPHRPARAGVECCAGLVRGAGPVPGGHAHVQRPARPRKALPGLHPVGRWRHPERPAGTAAGRAVQREPPHSEPNQPPRVAIHYRSKTARMTGRVF